MVELVVDIVSCLPRERTGQKAHGHLAGCRNGCQSQNNAFEPTLTVTKVTNEQQLTIFGRIAQLVRARP